MLIISMRKSEGPSRPGGADLGTIQWIAVLSKEWRK